MPVESLKKKQARARKIIRLLRKLYPEAKCSLDFGSVHELMVATILSAQCTDERVNMVTPALFDKYRSIEEFANANPEELERDIYSTGFYANKTKSIIRSAKQLLDKYDGRIPETLDELVKLAGVGRKTGSVVLGVGFGKAEGIVVDTHVTRISRLLGFTKEKSPVKIEKDLMKILWKIEKSDWIDYSHLLIFHGREVCIARRPDCSSCVLRKLCPSADL